MSDLKTLPQLAREYGVSERRADYAAKSRHIEPSGRIGIVRVYDASAAHQLKAAIETIAGRKGELAHA